MDNRRGFIMHCLNFGRPFDIKIWMLNTVLYLVHSASAASLHPPPRKDFVNTQEIGRAAAY